MKTIQNNDPSCLAVEDLALEQATGGVVRAIASAAPVQGIYANVQIDGDAIAKLEELEQVNIDKLALDRVLSGQGLAGFRIDQLAGGYEDDAGRC